MLVAGPATLQQRLSEAARCSNSIKPEAARRVYVVVS